MSDADAKPASGGAAAPRAAEAATGGDLARARVTMDPARLAEVERRYLGGQSVARIERELAKEWQRTRRTVRRYLAIVRRRTAAAYAAQSPEDHRARIEALLVGAYDAAAAGSGKFGPDAKAMVQAARVMAEVAGVLAPTRIDATLRPPPDLSGLTPAELDAFEAVLRKIGGGRVGG